jgi:hypothetical protein
VAPFGGFDRALGEFPSPFETSEERFGVRLIGEEDIPHSGLARTPMRLVVRLGSVALEP